MGVINNLQAVKASCGAAAGNVAVVPFDLCGSYEDIEKAAKKADEAYGGVDYLIHNAGGSRMHGTPHMTS